MNFIAANSFQNIYDLTYNSNKGIWTKIMFSMHSSVWGFGINRDSIVKQFMNKWNAAVMIAIFSYSLIHNMIRVIWYVPHVLMIEMNPLLLLKKLFWMNFYFNKKLDWRKKLTWIQGRWKSQYQVNYVDWAYEKYWRIRLYRWGLLLLLNKQCLLLFAFR